MTTSTPSRVRARGYFLMRMDTLGEIEKAIMKNFGASGAYVILYNAGREVGASAYKRYARLIGGEDKSKILARFVRRKEMANWGKFEFNLRKDRLQTLRIFDPFEASLGREFKEVVRRRCWCPVLRGYLEAFLSSLLKKSVELEPSSCVIQLDRFCELQVTQPQTPRARNHITNIAR